MIYERADRGWTCLGCGCLVGNKEVHDRWHAIVTIDPRKYGAETIADDQKGRRLEREP